MIISSAYLPPAWYFKKITGGEDVFVEAHEHFIKQTLRNRCHILSPNGIQHLIIPVSHKKGFNIPILELEIDNSHQWQRQHWRSLEAAYRRSAYFEFYADEIQPFFSNRYQTLLEFNNGILQLFLKLMNIELTVKLTEDFTGYEEASSSDYRTWCNSSIPDARGIDKPYPQVFSNRYDFIPGLSIADVLFNKGPEAKEIFS